MSYIVVGIYQVEVHQEFDTLQDAVDWARDLIDKNPAANLMVNGEGIQASVYKPAERVEA